MALQDLAAENDAKAGTWTRYFSMLTHAEIGEHEEALDELEDLLTRPSQLSVQYVRTDPLLATLREHPRMQAVLKGED
jgi:hypothetical protein